MATSVGARRCGQDGARGTRRDDQRAGDEVSGALSKNDALTALARRQRVGSWKLAR